MHYVSVDSVDEIPSMIKRLQADQEWARTIARAGQAQMASLDVDEVLKRGVWITPCGSAWLGKGRSVSYQWAWFDWFEEGATGRVAVGVGGWW